MHISDVIWNYFLFSRKSNTTQHSWRNTCAMTVRWLHLSLFGKISRNYVKHLGIWDKKKISNGCKVSGKLWILSLHNQNSSWQWHINVACNDIKWTYFIKGICKHAKVNSKFGCSCYFCCCKRLSYQCAAKQKKEKIFFHCLKNV